VTNQLSKETVMKKVLMIGLIVALTFIIIGGAGVVYARVSNSDEIPARTLTRFSDGENVVRLYSYGRGGMMGEYENGVCPGGNAQGYGPGGMMQGYGYRSGGMMQGNNSGCGVQGYGPGGMMGRLGRGITRGEGLMHELMISAYADAVDLTADEVETRLEAGESIKEIALAQGVTEDEFPDLVVQVRQTALDAAVSDGTITQDQADLMLEHMNNNVGQGFGPGFNQGFDGCPMMDGDE
jgi:hypothetical protein